MNSNTPFHAKKDLIEKLDFTTYTKVMIIFLLRPGFPRRSLFSFEMTSSSPGILPPLIILYDDGFEAFCIPPNYAKYRSSYQIRAPLKQTENIWIGWKRCEPWVCILLLHGKILHWYNIRIKSTNTIRRKFRIYHTSAMHQNPLSWPRY